MKIASHSPPRRRLWSLAGLVVLDAVMFGLSNPNKAPTFMLIVGFLLVSFNIYFVIINCLRLGRWYGLASSRHHRRFARTTAGLVAGLIALQSIGELSSHDILLAFPLVLLTYLYMSYGKPAKQPVNA